MDCSEWEDTVVETYKLKEIPSFIFFKPSPKSGFDLYDLGVNYEKALYNLYNEYKTTIKQGGFNEIIDFTKSTFQENKIPLIFLFGGVLNLIK